MAFDWKTIERLARAHHSEMRAGAYNVKSLRRFLEFWWSMTFNRPMKDPLLEAYTLEELAYEFLRRHFVAHDPAEEDAKKAREADDERWAREMLKKIKEKGSPVPPEPKKKPPKQAAKKAPKGPALEDLPDIDIKFE